MTTLHSGHTRAAWWSQTFLALVTHPLYCLGGLMLAIGLDSLMEKRVDGVMFPEASAPLIWAALATSPAAVGWLRLQWKVYSASAFGVALYFFTHNFDVAAVEAFGLTAYVHFLCLQFGDSVLPHHVLMGNFVASTIGFALNLAAALFDKRSKTKKT